MRRMLLGLTVTLAMSAAAIAQDKTGPNGGLVSGKAGHETELVLSASELTVFLLDDGKAESTKGASVKAVVQEAGKATTIELANIDDKKLVGKLAAPLGKGAIVVLTGKDDHGHTITARYVLK